MKILIKHANLIPMAEKQEQVLKDVDILIQDDEIVKIENNISDEADKIIDAKNKIVLPGFINAHTHLPMSIFRDTLEGYNLQDWLNKRIWPAEDKLTNEDIYNATMLSCIEAIKTGTTTIQDHYFKTEEIIKAGLDTGLRMDVTRVLMDIDNDLETRKQELIKLINEYQNKYSTIRINVGIHGLYTSSSKTVEEAINIAKQNNSNIHMHFCENQKEVEDIKNMYNAKTPAEVLFKYFTKTKNVLAHCVKLTKEEISAISKTNSSVVHCPVSNLKLGCGIAPIATLQENGVNVALGTDGQGSGSSLDMFETMKYASLLQKGINENPKEMTAYQTLKMATINGAKALGLEEKIGSIVVGKKADIIIVELENVVNQPINDIVSNIVYNAKGSNVNTTIINGKIVMENRRVLNCNEENIYEKCQKIAKRILQD